MGEINAPKTHIHHIQDDSHSHQDYAHFTPHRPHLSAREVWRNGGVDSFLNRRKIFLLNSNTFYAINFLYPPLVPAYYFSLAHTLLSFVYAYTHNSWHYLFWKDYNWHHCLWKEKKDVYYFWKKNKWHHCLMEGKLNMCLWHLHLH